MQDGAGDVGTVDVTAAPASTVEVVATMVIEVGSEVVLVTVVELVAGVGVVVVVLVCSTIVVVVGDTTVATASGVA